VLLSDVSQLQGDALSLETAAMFLIKLGTHGLPSDDAHRNTIALHRPEEMLQIFENGRGIGLCGGEYAGVP